MVGSGGVRKVLALLLKTNDMKVRRNNRAIKVFTLESLIVFMLAVTYIISMVSII